MNSAWLIVNDSCLRGHHSFLRMEGDTPFVTANHSTLEHKQGKQCQVQVERTKNPEGRKKMHQKKHGSHMKTTTAELISSSAQMQRGKASDGNWLLPSENRTTRKHYSAHSALLFSALFTGIHKKTQFSSYQTRHVLQNILPVKNQSPCKDVFSLSSVHSVPVFVCSHSPQKDVHVIHRHVDFLLPCFISVSAVAFEC